MPGLVLTVKRGGRVIIDGSIIVELVEVDRGRASIRFIAPKEIGIFREEVLKKALQSKGPGNVSQVKAPISQANQSGPAGVEGAGG